MMDRRHGSLHVVTAGYIRYIAHAHYEQQLTDEELAWAMVATAKLLDKACGAVVADAIRMIQDYHDRQELNEGEIAQAMLVAASFLDEAWSGLVEECVADAIRLATAHREKLQ